MQFFSWFYDPRVHVNRYVNTNCTVYLLQINICNFMIQYFVSLTFTIGWKIGLTITSVNKPVGIARRAP